MRKVFSFYALLLFLVAAMFSCGDDYDDTALRNDVNDLKSRVEKLETWCTTANGQITALQGLVEALQNNDYITGITPVMEGTKEVGYTLTFKKGTPITIMHGKDGAAGAAGTDGVTPIIGVAKDTDGNYYWTVKTGTAEATWLLDAEGNKIRTTGDKGADGTIGKDGVAPVLSIEKDGDTYYWKVNGEWMKAADGTKVPATGAKGETGAAGPSGSNGTPGTDGDSFFKSVTSYPDKGYVEFEPTSGEKFQVPLLSTTVSFDKYEPKQITATGSATDVIVTLPLTLKKASFAAIKADITNVAGTNSAITRATPERWTVTLIAPTFKVDGTIDAQPTVNVTVPTTATEGETALLKVTVVGTDGNESSSTRVLYYSTNVAVTDVTLDKTTLTVKAGKTGTLAATVAPANASNKNVTWTSSNDSVATVTGGIVTGVKAGTATITATGDGNKTATCAVTVENIAVTNITLADATVSLGDKKTLTATIVPIDATIKTVTWSSSNTGVATINATTGEVTAVAVGETTITATATGGSGVTGTCKVKVEDKPSITWAVGNLVADGANGGCKVGAATDGGLFFQFGSLVGWSETGSPTVAVKPAAFNGKEDWTETGKIWQGTTGTVPFTVKNSGSEDEKAGIGDPCRYYLGDTWRLPTKGEYEALFKNGGYPSGTWKWENASATNKNLTFPASGYRSRVGSLTFVGTYGYYWSASPHDASDGDSLFFADSRMTPSDYSNRAVGMPVRCVQNASN